MTLSIQTHLRRALEEAETNSQPVKLSGPLSEAFTQMLGHEYGKAADDKDNQPALESQQMEHTAMRQLASLLVQSEVPVNQSALQVYGVSQNEVTPDDVIKVTQDISTLAPEQRKDYVVIIKEDVHTGETQTKLEEVTALESFARVFGVKVYPSLEAFAQARFG